MFADWNWDGKTLHVRNDRWGFQPLFYAADADRIAVATSIPRLLQLGAPADLDEAALAVFLRLSHFLVSDTPFRAIRALPRDGRLTWSAGALRVSSAIVPPVSERLSKAAIVDGYVTLYNGGFRPATIGSSCPSAAGAIPVICCSSSLASGAVRSRP